MEQRDKRKIDCKDERKGKEDQIMIHIHSASNTICDPYGCDLHHVCVFSLTSLAPFLL